MILQPSPHVCWIARAALDLGDSVVHAMATCRGLAGRVSVAKAKEHQAFVWYNSPEDFHLTFSLWLAGRHLCGIIPFESG